MILLIIALPYILLVCSAEANGNANTPTFELTLDPTSREAWSDWRPKHETNTSFVVNLKGTTSSGDPISISSVTFTFRLTEVSQWEGVCMNYDGETDMSNSYDLFFREEDNPDSAGQTFTVTDYKNA